jgi:hypothetical protein
MTINLEKLGNYWQIGSIIISLVVALTYFVIENKEANNTIQELSVANKTLTEKVSKLEGHTDGFNHAIKMFMEHPPGLMEYRINILEKKVFGYETPNTNIQRDSISPPRIN